MMIITHRITNFSQHHNTNAGISVRLNMLAKHTCVSGKRSRLHMSALRRMCVSLVVIQIVIKIKTHKLCSYKHKASLQHHSLLSVYD